MMNKYLRAAENLNESQEHYEDVMQVLMAAQINLWTRQIEHAESRRSFDPEAMDIMQPKVPKGTSETHVFPDRD